MDPESPLSTVPNSEAENTSQEVEVYVFSPIPEWGIFIIISWIQAAASQNKRPANCYPEETTMQEIAHIM
jgi:hypothetical protein